MLDVFGLFSVPTLYVLIGISVLLIVAIILSIVAIAKSSAMKKKYNIMMEGSEGKSIEKIIKEYTDDVKLLKETYENNTKSIKDIYDKMQYTFQKVGIVKYDAFHEMGGKLSFAICMLDKNDNGCLVNVLYYIRYYSSIAIIIFIILIINYIVDFSAKLNITHSSSNCLL